MEIWFLPPESAAGFGTLVLFALHAYAFGDALIRPPAAYVSAGKKTKQFWLILTGLAALCTLTLSNVTFTLVIAATVIALIYVLDVRPAVQTYRGPRGGGRKPSGPRGGW